MIVADKLSKRFENFLAVSGMSFSVQPGQVLVFLGPNGSGKTTTVRMLSSVLKPTSGSAQVAGYDVALQPREVRARVGVLTEQHGLYGRMTSLEYLAFFGRLYQQDPKKTRARAAAMLEQFGIDGAVNQRLGTYSKGMRQKLALIRTLIHDPPVLLLDEPTSAMDPASALVVREVIRQQSKDGRALLLCTHNLFEAEMLGDRVAVVRKGRILYQDSIAAFKRELLGPSQYRARFARPVGDWTPDLPRGVRLMERGQAWIRFQVDEPLNSNPLLLHQMLEQSFQLVAFEEMTRNLEEAYVEAVSRYTGEEAPHAG